MLGKAVDYLLPMPTVTEISLEHQILDMDERVRDMLFKKIENNKYYKSKVRF